MGRPTLYSRGYKAVNSNGGTYCTTESGGALMTISLEYRKVIQCLGFGL